MALKRKRTTIPLDVTIEILLRLPARSIARFRLVCKLWRSETLDPNFIDAHLDLSKVRPPSILLAPLLRPHNDFIILCDSCTSKHQFLPPPLPTGYEDEVLFHGSCNGIICISGNDRSVRLLNPATGDSLTLPKTTSDWRLHLGFHPVTKEYKVINLYAYNSSNPQCQVYTVGTDSSWRNIDTTSTDIVPFYGFHAAVVNGVMYFITSLGYTCSITAFDLKDESFKQFPCPNLESQDFYIIRGIVELQGNVCVSLKNERKLDMWRFNIDNFGWTLMYSISPWDVMDPTSLLFIHKDKMLTWELFSEDGKNRSGYRYRNANMLCYRDVKGNTRGNKILFVHENDYEAHVHVESLVALPNQ